MKIIILFLIIQILNKNNYFIFNNYFYSMPIDWKFAMKNSKRKDFRCFHLIVSSNCVFVKADTVCIEQFAYILYKK